MSLENREQVVHRISQWYEKNENEYLKFDRITDPLHPVEDICGILYLHQKCGARKASNRKGFCDFISSAEHDEIWFDAQEIKNLTEDDVVYLMRCGIRWDSDVESFGAFV